MEELKEKVKKEIYNKTSEKKVNKTEEQEEIEKLKE
jgi:hypothetical protein